MGCAQKSKPQEQYNVQIDTDSMAIADLIIGFGIASLVVVSVILGHRAHKRKLARQRPTLESNNQLQMSVINEQHSPSPRPSVDKTQTPVEPVVVDKMWTRRSLVLDHNDFMSNGRNSRLQSPARTIDGIDFNDDNNQPFANIYISIRKLIDFD